MPDLDKLPPPNQLFGSVKSDLPSPNELFEGDTIKPIIKKVPRQDFIPNVDVQGVEKAFQIIDEIPDIDTGKKDILKDLTKRGANTETLSKSILTLQGHHPHQEGSSNYYIDKDGVPNPLKTNEKPPKEYHVASVWGTQAEADKDNPLQSFNKHLLNGVIMAVEGQISTAEIMNPYLEELRSKAPVDANYWQGMKNTLSSLKLETPSAEKVPIFKTEGMKSYEDLLDPERWNPTSGNIQGNILQGIESVIAFGLGRGGGLAKNAPALGQKVLTGLSSYNLAATQMLDVADQAGLEGKEKIAFGSIAAVPQAAIESMFGIGSLFTKNAIARTEMQNIARVAGERFAASGMTRESLDLLHKEMTAGATEVAKKFGTQFGKTMAGETIEEPLQGLAEDSSKMLYDKLKEVDVFNADAFTPESMGKRVNEAIAGALGSVGGAGLGARRSVQIAKHKAQNENAFAISQQGEDAIANFNKNVDAAIQNGDVTAEEGERAKFKVNAFAEYNQQLSDANRELNDEEKRKAFDLSFQISGINTEIPTEKSELDKLSPIQLAEVNSKKDIAKGLQKELDEILKKKNVETEPTVAAQTLSEVENKDAAYEEQGTVNPEKEETVSKEKRAALEKELDDLMNKGSEIFTQRRAELMAEGKTSKEASDITGELWRETEQGKRATEIEKLLAPKETEGKAENKPKPKETVEEKPVEKKTEKVPVRDLSSVNIGDRITDVNGKTGTVTGINNGAVEMKMDSGATMTANPKFVELFKEVEVAPPVEKPSRRKISEVDTKEWNDKNKTTSIEKKKILQEHLKSTPNNQMDAHLQEGENGVISAITEDGKRIDLAQSAQSTMGKTVDYIKRDNLPATKQIGKYDKGGKLRAKKDFVEGSLRELKEEQGATFDKALENVYRDQLEKHYEAPTKRPLFLFKEPIAIKRVEFDSLDKDGKPIRKAVLSVYNKQTGKHIVFVREHDKGKSDYTKVPTDGKHLQAIIKANHLTDEIKPYTVKGSEQVAEKKDEPVVEDKLDKSKADKNTIVTKIKQKISSYNFLSKKDKKSEVGRSLFKSIQDDVAELGYEIRLLKSGGIALLNEFGKKVYDKPTPRSKDAIQSEKERKAYEKKALSATPESVEHMVAMDIANGVRFNQQELIDITGTEANTIPLGLTQKEGGESFEFYRLRIEEHGGTIVQDEQEVANEAATEVALYTGSTTFRADAKAKAIEMYEKIENGGLTNAEIESMQEEYADPNEDPITDEFLKDREEQDNARKSAEDEGQFQKPQELQYAEGQLKKAEDELKAAKNAFDNKRKELDKALIEDQEDLFGERKSTQEDNLFDERASLDARNDAVRPLKDRYTAAIANVKKWQEKVNEIQSKPYSQQSLFQKKAAVQGVIDKIVNKLKANFKNIKVVYDKNLKAAAKVQGNTITINPYYAGTDTPIHEYGHILIDAIGYNNKVIQAAIKQLQGTPLWDEIAARYPLTETYTNEMLGKEVLAEAIGREGAGIFDKVSEQSKFKTFLDYIFDWLKTKLGLNKNIAKSLAKQIIGGIGTKELEGTNQTEQYQKLDEINNAESLQDFSLDDLITIYNDALVMEDSELRTAAMKRIAYFLNETQRELLRKNKNFIDKEANKKDLKWRDVQFKVLSHMTQNFPELQKLSPLFDAAYLDKVTEANSRKKEFETLAKAVMSEYNKKIGIVKRVAGMLPFSSNSAKYFEFLDDNGKLRTNTKGLSAAQIAFLNHYKELVALRSKQVDENGNIVQDDILKIDKGFQETFKTEGLMSALSNYFGGSNLADIEVTYTNPNTGTREVVSYSEAQKAILSYAKKGLTQKGVALAKLLQIAYKAKKDSGGGAYGINYNGRLTNKFDKPRPKDMGYSKDFYRAVQLFIDDYTHVKHMSKFVPIVNSLDLLYSQGYGEQLAKPYAKQWLKEWSQAQIYQTEKVTDPIIDSSLKFIRTLTSQIVMGFNIPANLMNVFIGNYNSWRAENGKTLATGNNRLFGEIGKREFKKEYGYGALNPKAVEILRKYAVVNLDLDSYPEFSVGKLFQKVAFAGQQYGELQIQGSAFLGKMSEKEWNSFEYKNGKLTIKGDEKAINKRLIEIKNEITDIQGKYSAKDRRNFARGEFGKNLAQFKTWIPDWWKVRLGAEYIDGNGQTKRGSWNMFTADAIAELKNDFSKANGYGFEIKNGIPAIRNKQIASNLKGAMAVALMLVLTNSGDDDKKKRHKALSLNNALGNLLFILDFDQMKYTIKNPVASIGTVNKFIETLEGVWDMDSKGFMKDSKSLIPMNKVLDVPEQIEEAIGE